jgi:hypothetical protein
MASRDSGVDPRYAAQFQRGFDGPAVMSAPAPAISAPAPTAPEATPRIQIDRMPTSPAAPEEPEAAGVEVTPDRIVPRSEWALLIVGAGAIVASIWLLWIVATDITPYTSAASTLADYTWYNVRGTLPAPLFSGGFIAIAGWLVVRGIRTGRGA